MTQFLKIHFLSRNTQKVVFISPNFKAFIGFRILLAVIQHPVFYVQINPDLFTLRT